MKALNEVDLKGYSLQLNQWAGSTVQEVVTAEKYLALKFYGGARGVRLLIFDLSPGTPLVGLGARLPAGFKKKPKPLGLFLKARLIGQKLVDVEMMSELGRVLRFQFGSQTEISGELLFRAFPHGQNLSAQFGDKALHWSKPKELVAKDNHLENDSGVVSNFCPEKFQKELSIHWGWERERKNLLSPVVTVSPIEKERKKLLKKNRRLVEKLSSERSELSTQHWGEVGHDLVRLQSLQVPASRETYVNRAESLAWNIERCFKEAKKQTKKEERLELRLAELNQEFEDLNREDWEPATPLNPSKKAAALKAVQRGIVLGKDLRGEWGRSAKENLALLRAAKPWDLWLHIKDEPGSHGILHRPKKTKVTDEQIRELARHVLKQSLGQKKSAQSDLSYDVIIAECRYVRPIPGDRLGRVRVQNERVLSVHL